MLYKKRHKFRLIPDWEKQFSVWFSWPVRTDIWTESLDLIKIQLVKLYQICSKFQKVCVICPYREKNNLISKLKDYGDMKNIELYNYETDDIWIRDYGPIFLKSNKDNSLLMTNWKFNAWGGKFENYSKDDSFNDWFSKVIGVEKKSYDFVLEGGAIESNGDGILATTRSVIENRNRILKKNKIDWDSLLKKEFYLDNIIWFEKGLEGDDTDGHIDNIFRFAPNKTLIHLNTSNPSFKYNISNILNSNKGKIGEYKFFSMPLPNPIYFKDNLLAASYMNYLVINDAIIFPIFNQIKDAHAISIISDIFPHRTIVPFDCSDIIKEGGGLHCLSLNQPI